MRALSLALSYTLCQSCMICSDVLEKTGQDWIGLDWIRLVLVDSIDLNYTRPICMA